MDATDQGHFPAHKVAMYELLLRQLQDDGFEAEVQALTAQLHLRANTKVEKDALLDIYTKSLKWAFGDEPQPEWQPLHCSPVPPLGPQEKVLDLEGMPIPTGTSQTPDPTKKPPEVRLLYTASHKSHCRSVAFSTDGRFCATGCTDGSIKILDTAKMRVCAASTEGPVGRMRVTEEELMKPIVRVLQDHIQGVTCLAFHPTNPTLFSGSSDKAVKIFDLTRPPGHKKAFSVLQDVYAVKSICIHPCGDFLFVGTTHQALRMYDLQTLSCFTTSHQDQHHTAGINDLRCTVTGNFWPALRPMAPSSFGMPSPIAWSMLCRRLTVGLLSHLFDGVEASATCYLQETMEGIDYGMFEWARKFSAWALGQDLPTSAQPLSSMVKGTSQRQTAT